MNAIGTHQHTFDFDEKPPEKFRFIPLGDAHIGARGSDEDHLKQYVGEIAADPNCFWWDMGDPCDFINYSDPRFSPEDLAEWVNMEDLANLHFEQAERYLLLTRPIHDKCLFRLSGNHDESVKRHYHFDIGSYISGKMQTPHLGYAAFVQLRWRWLVGAKPSSQTRMMFVHHGWGGGRTEGGLVNKVVAFLLGHDADAFFMGHVHGTHAFKKSRLEMAMYRKKPTLVSRDICFGLTGTFLKQAEYATQAGYNPSFIGAIEYTVKPFVHRAKYKREILHDVGTLTL